MAAHAVLRASALVLLTASSGATTLTPEDLRDIAELSVDDVVDVVRTDFGLPCMAGGFKTLHLDGEALAMLRPSDFSGDARKQFFPLCVGVHWRKLWRWLGVGEDDDGRAAAERGATAAQSSAIAADERPRRQRRRLGASSTTTNYSGVWLANNKSAVTFGEDGDAVLSRSGPGYLSTFGLEVDELFVDGDPVYAHPKRCASVNATSVLGEYPTTALAVQDGDYIVENNVICTPDEVSDGNDPGWAYRPTPGNRWRCSEEGGVAAPALPLCYPSNFTFDGFGADSLVYYVDAWASPPFDDTWRDLSGANTDHHMKWTQTKSTSTHVYAFDSDDNGGAVVFKGDGHSFVATEVENFPVGNSAFTWEWCMSVGSWASSPHVFHLGQNAAYKANGLFLPDTGQVRHYFWNDGNTIATGIATNEIVHFAITYDQNTFKGFINGELVYSTPASSKTVTHNDDESFMIGGGTVTLDRTGFTGNMYYLRLYNDSLTDEEIGLHFSDSLKDFQYRHLPGSQ